MKKLVGALMTIALVCMVFIPDAGAAGPTILWDFENFSNGKTIEQAGIGVVTSTTYKPAFVGVSNDPFGFNRKGNCLKFTTGTWDKGDTWQNFELNVPSNMQDFSKYKYLGFFANETQSDYNTLGLQIFFKDAENQLWGWKSVTKDCFGFLRYLSADGPYAVDWVGTDWGAMGFSGCWFNDFVFMKLDPKLFIRISGTGKNSFDFTKVKSLHIRIDGGIMGAGEGANYYFDNFLLCSDVQINASNQLVLDGTPFSDPEGMQPKAVPASSSSASSSSSSKASSVSSKTISASSDTATSSELSQSQAESIESTTDVSSQDTSTVTESTVETNNSGGEKGQDGNSIGLIIGIIAAVIVIAGVGMGLFFVLKKKK